MHVDPHDSRSPRVSAAEPAVRLAGPGELKAVRYGCIGPMRTTLRLRPAGERIEVVASCGAETLKGSLSPPELAQFVEDLRRAQTEPRAAAAPFVGQPAAPPGPPPHTGNYGHEVSFFLPLADGPFSGSSGIDVIERLAQQIWAECRARGGQPRQGGGLWARFVGALRTFFALPGVT